MMAENRIVTTEKDLNIYIIGLINDTNFYVAKNMGKDLEDKFSYIHLTSQTLIEFDWDQFIRKKIKEIGGHMWTYSDNLLIFLEDQLIVSPEDNMMPAGSLNAFISWAKVYFAYEDYRDESIYEKLMLENYVNYMNSRPHIYSYFDMEIDGMPIGRLLFRLFRDKLPISCENFQMICSGEKHRKDRTINTSYRSTIIHRVVSQGYIQGGDLYLGKGSFNESAWSSLFADESFPISHNKRGILGYANNGPNTNGSQFYITLAPCEWMNKKFVAFGEVIEGSAVLKQIEELPTVIERPLNKVEIVQCGNLEFMQ
ncbi:hypothetical protein SNEBB_004485 [Seison nebaliae]|nr:hypothetical protein SNEBB_004485 [Seison nebaliae]